MKKVYQEPELSVLILSSNDVITTSGFLGDEDVLLPLD